MVWVSRATVKPPPSPRPRLSACNRRRRLGFDRLKCFCKKRRPRTSLRARLCAGRREVAQRRQLVITIAAPPPAARQRQGPIGANRSARLGRRVEERACSLERLSERPGHDAVRSRGAAPAAAVAGRRRRPSHTDHRRRRWPRARPGVAAALAPSGRAGPLRRAPARRRRAEHRRRRLPAIRSAPPASPAAPRPLRRRRAAVGAVGVVHVRRGGRTGIGRGGDLAVGGRRPSTPAAARARRTQRRPAGGARAAGRQPPSELRQPRAHPTQGLPPAVATAAVGRAVAVVVVVAVLRRCAARVRIVRHAKIRGVARDSTRRAAAVQHVFARDDADDLRARLYDEEVAQAHRAEEARDAAERGVLQSHESGFIDVQPRVDEEVEVAVEAEGASGRSVSANHGRRKSSAHSGGDVVRGKGGAWAEAEVRRRRPPFDELALGEDREELLA